MLAAATLSSLFLSGSAAATWSAEAKVQSESIRVIFTQAETERQAGGEAVYIGITAPFWTPTESQILELEQRLPNFLSSSSEPRASLIPPKLGGYKRQYYGFTSMGKKRIFLNAFCASVAYSKDYWRSHLVFVLDGGECYFQVTYDPEAKQFTSISINGYA